MINWHELAEDIFHKHLQFEHTKRMPMYFGFIVIFFIIIKSILLCIDIRWWLNLIGMSLNLLAALLIGEGTFVKTYRDEINGSGRNISYQQTNFLKIGTNLLLVGFLLQLISMIIPI